MAMASLSTERRGETGAWAMARRAQARLSPREWCPLCGSTAHESDGVVEAKVSLLTCSHCRAFVMEKRLIDIVMNAREWNLRPVLRHVACLSRAAQSAAAHGSVLVITSTNWICLAMEQQRLDERPAIAIDA